MADLSRRSLSRKAGKTRLRSAQLNFGEAKAESTGIEPVRAYAHQFSRLTHYRPAHSPDYSILPLKISIHFTQFGKFFLFCLKI